MWICYIVGHKVNTKITILCGMTPCNFVRTCSPHVQVQSFSRCQVGACHYTKYVVEVAGHRNVKCSSFIASSFSTQSPSTQMHLSHLGTSLKIPTQQKSGPYIRSHSQTTISPCSFSCNRQPPSQALLQRPKPMTVRFPQSVPQLCP